MGKDNTTSLENEINSLNQVLSQTQEKTKAIDKKTSKKKLSETHCSKATDKENAPLSESKNSIINSQVSKSS